MELFLLPQISVMLGCGLLRVDIGVADQNLRLNLIRPRVAVFLRHASNLVLPVGSELHKCACFDQRVELILRRTPDNIGGGVVYLRDNACSQVASAQTGNFDIEAGCFCIFLHPSITTRTKVVGCQYERLASRLLSQNFCHGFFRSSSRACSGLCCGRVARTATSGQSTCCHCNGHPLQDITTRNFAFHNCILLKCLRLKADVCPIIETTLSCCQTLG